MTRAIRAWIMATILATGAVGCSASDDATTGTDVRPAPELQADELQAAEQICDVDERFCEVHDRFYVVRSIVYGPPFDESPEEIADLLAESHALMAEWVRLAPDDIRPRIEHVLAEFALPIDAETERLGWDPEAAINTELALGIFADTELNAVVDEIDDYMQQCCRRVEDLAVPTDPVILDDRTVVVYNGTPSLNEALVWGFGRFEAAGLDVPPIGSATFTVQSEMCDEIRGRYLPTARGIELELCMDERTACWEDPDADPDTCAGHCPEHVPGVLAIVLHEIAHAWLDAHLDDIDVDGFLAHVGLETWRDRELPWDQNGHEHAADTIAWGLMDRDIEMLRIGQPPTDELAEGFRILTGTDPLPKDAEDPMPATP